MQRQIPPGRAFSCTAPTLAPNLGCAQRNLQPPQVEASSGSIAVRKDGGNPRASLIGMIGIMLNAHDYDLSSRRRALQAAPEEVREPPEHAGGHRPAPRLRAIAHREVGDE